MSELTLLAQDATKTTPDCALYDSEFQKLKAYISDVAAKQFSGVPLFGNAGLSVTTDSEGAAPTVLTAVDMNDAAYTNLLAAGVTTTDAADAAAAQPLVNTALAQLATDRANVGANIVVLSSYADQLGVLKDNLTAANSRIRDVDVAEESADCARFNILVQAGTAMLAQANQTP